MTDEMLFELDNNDCLIHRTTEGYYKVELTSPWDDPGIIYSCDFYKIDPTSATGYEQENNYPAWDAWHDVSDWSALKETILKHKEQNNDR